MKNVSHYVLSDVDALEAIRKLSVFPKDADYVSLYFNEAARVVRNILNTDYFISNFYRILFYNKNGVVIATTHEERKMNAGMNLDALPWIWAVCSHRPSRGRLGGEEAECLFCSKGNPGE